MQLLGKNGLSYSCAPNFAFDLAARRTSDDDMAGLDLGDVLGINNGSERVHPETIKRFNERFARFNLKDTAIRPSYGLAEATVYVAAPKMGRPNTFRFDYSAPIEWRDKAQQERSWRRYRPRQLRRPPCVQCADREPRN